jgi:hypothetical protein
MVARKYARPSGPPSATQTNQQRWFAIATAYWRDTLTDAQRAAWTAYAVANPVISNSQAVNIGGIGIFGRYAIHNLALGVAIMPDAPSGPPPATDPNTYSNGGIAWDDLITNTITVAWTGTPATEEGLIATVELTGGLIGSRRVRETDYRYARHLSRSIWTHTTTTEASVSYNIPTTDLLNPIPTGEFHRYGWRIRLWRQNTPTPHWTATGTGQAPAAARPLGIFFARVEFGQGPTICLVKVFRMSI